MRYLGTLCGVRFSTVTLPLFPLPWLQILCQCYPIMQLLAVAMNGLDLLPVLHPRQEP